MFSTKNAGSLRNHLLACTWPLRSATGTGFSDKVLQDQAPDPFDDEPLENSKRLKHATAAWEDVLDGADDGLVDDGGNAMIDSLGPAANGSRERVTHHLHIEMRNMSINM